jgi:uncharacterized protein YukE
MSFTVETDNLRSQAKFWADSKTHVDQVKQTLAEVVGQGSAFGVMAGSAGVSGMYDAWTQKMDDCLADASYSFTYLDAALRSTADRYDDSDETSAMNMKELDKLLDEGMYHRD